MISSYDILHIHSPAWKVHFCLRVVVSILHGYQTKPNCLLTTTLFVIASYFSPASLTEGKAISVN